MGLRVLFSFIKTFAAHREFFFRYTWPLKVAAFRAGRKLRLAAGRAHGEKSWPVTAVVPYYGDHALLPWFLTYYRKLGVDFFVFLDLSADQDLGTRLGETADCAVWITKTFIQPGKIIHALNYLRHAYASKRWCLSVEPYDFFVFPKSETRHIRDLTEFLETEHRKHIYAIVVDAYGDRPAAEMAFSETVSPFEQLPYFDRFGYQAMVGDALRVVPILGGVQRRFLYRDEPHKAPALNRIPLLKINWETYYLASTRVVVPAHHNTPHCDWHASTTACLLRYALLSNEIALHIAKQVEPGQLHQESITPLYDGSGAMTAAALKNEVSQRYQSSSDLIECGLISNGQWF
jgi:hypothetical protein